MTRIRCLKCLEKGVVVELNYRKAQASDSAYYQCPSCGLKTYVDYGETESGDRVKFMPLPKPDLETEEDIPAEAQLNLLETYIRKRFKN